MPLLVQVVYVVPNLGIDGRTAKKYPNEIYNGDACDRKNNRLTPSIVGIEESTRAFPNPFGNTLTLEWLSEAQDVDIHLNNLLGQQVLCQKIWFDGKHQLPLNQLPEGIYILKIVGDGIYEELRVIKE